MDRPWACASIAYQRGIYQAMEKFGNLVGANRAEAAWLKEFKDENHSQVLPQEHRYAIEHSVLRFFLAFFLVALARRGLSASVFFFSAPEPPCRIPAADNATGQ